MNLTITQTQILEMAVKYMMENDSEFCLVPAHPSSIGALGKTGLITHHESPNGYVCIQELKRYTFRLTMAGVLHCAYEFEDFGAYLESKLDDSLTN